MTENKQDMPHDTQRGLGSNGSRATDDTDNDPAAINRRVASESGTFATSALARAAAHFSGADAPPDNAIELWGRRIGRGLAVVFAIYLVFSLLGMVSP